MLYRPPETKNAFYGCFLLACDPMALELYSISGIWYNLTKFLLIAGMSEALVPVLFVDR